LYRGITHFINNNFVKIHIFSELLMTFSTYGANNPKTCREILEVLGDEITDQRGPLEVLGD
jgi:hypothetical protein